VLASGWHLLFPGVLEQRHNDRAGISEHGERRFCGRTYFVRRVVRLDQGTGRRSQDRRGVIDGVLGPGQQAAVEREEPGDDCL
jgi:hypothetical protein